MTRGAANGITLINTRFECCIRGLRGRFIYGNMEPGLRKDSRPSLANQAATGNCYIFHAVIPLMCAIVLYWLP